MRQRPLTLAAISWIAGSGFSVLFDGTPFWLFMCGLTLFCPLAVVLARISWRRMALLWLVFVIGAAYWSYNESRNISSISESIHLQNDVTSMYVTGTVESPVQMDGDRVNFILRLKDEGEKISVQVKLATFEEKEIAATWRRGDVMEMQGSLERPGTPRNFGAFDYRNYLRNQRIHWLMKVSGAGKLHRLQTAQGYISVDSFFGKIDGMRNHLGKMIEQLFPNWQGGYMKGLLIGLDDDLEPDKYDQFTRLGLTHILAISGSHVAINVGLLFGLLRLCRVNKQTSLLIVLCCVPVYVLITGFSPSVIRSGIMTMLGLYLMRRGLLKDGLNVLSAAALFMLLWEPYLLLNVSFQLSFSVTAGLILFVPLIMPYLNWLPQRLRSGIAITIAAQLVSFPLTIYYFNQFSLLSLAANMILVPIIGLIVLPLGTAALLLGGIWITLGQWMAYPVRLLNAATFLITEWLDHRSGFMTYWKSPGLIWIILYFAVLYVLLTFESQRDKEVRLQGANTLIDDETAPLDYQGHLSQIYIAGAWKKNLVTILLITLLIGLLITGYQPANETGIGHVQFIDVGQGDCALITTPSGKNILIDGGGTVTFRKKGEEWRNRKSPYEVGTKSLVPLLKQRGIHRIHVVIATHGDQDHIGGLQAVLEQFPVDSLLINGSLADSDTMMKLMNTAITKNIPIYAPYKGMELQPDADTLLQFISPQFNVSEDGVPLIKEQNHLSVVFLLKLSGATFLFTGDMDESAEQSVLTNTNLSKYISSVDVMKVAHHGSKTSTSSEWINRWKPNASVISVGTSNTYGHPNPTVLERLEQVGSSVYRSDLHGEVQMYIKEGKILVRCRIP
ncbi:ComEC family competence protein [compost metagenome]